MKLLAGSFALGAILLTAASALAQPPPPPVPMEDPASTPDGLYPTDLPGRPLILPKSQMEIDANLRIPTNDAIDFFDLVILGVQARYSLGTIEPFFGMDLAIYKPDGVDVLQTIYGGARAAVGPGALKGTLFLFGPGGDDEVTEVEVDGSYEYKHHLNEQFAVVAEGGLAFYNASGSDDSSLTIFSLFGRGAGQIKLTPELSAEAGLLLSLPLSTSLSVGGMDVDVDGETLVGFHGMGLYNVGKFDAYGRLDIRDSGDNTTTIVTVGVLARPMM